MTLQVYFKHTKYISYAPLDKDRLLVTILQPNVFVSADAMNSLPQDYTFGQKRIPLQIVESEKERLDSITNVNKGVATAFVSSQIVISFFLAAAIKYLWGMADTL